ncbi:hypothetical protein HID58_079957, partial [Brassica napus]
DDNGVEEYEDSLVTKLWRLPGDESTAELKVDFTPSSHMCSSSTSHHLRNLAVTPSARRRKILPKSPLFFFISCSFNLPTHGSDMFVMGIMKQLFLCFERHRIFFFLVQLTHAVADVTDFRCSVFSLKLQPVEKSLRILEMKGCFV